MKATPKLEKPEKPTRIIGLDALKFFAITAIVIYHCFPSLLPGGFITVEVFFVISGFLIGQKLLRTREALGDKFGGPKSFFLFLWGRLKRFLPTLIFCMIIALSIAYFTDPDLLTRARSNSLAAVTFSTNIMSIISGHSYEDSLTPNLFNQTWFLALELQVCIICFLCIAGFFALSWSNKKTAKSKALLAITLLISLASFALMAIYGGWFKLYDRAYFGPDSHIGAFFLGTTLATFTFIKNIQPTTKKRRPIFIVLLTLSLALIGVITPFISYASPEAFIFALPLTAILSLIAIITVLKLQRQAPTKNHKIHPIKILEYLGTLSFAVYLLHYSLNILLPNLLNFWPTEIIPYITIAVSILLAILLQKFIIPFSKKHKIIFTILLLASLVLPIMSLIKAPEHSSIEESLEAGKQNQPEEIKTDEEVSIDYNGTVALANTLNNDIMKYFDKTDTFAKPYPVVIRTGGVGYNTSARAYYNTPDYSRVSALSSARVMVLGDSVVQGATSAIYNTVPGVFVDALQSRNMTDAINLLAGYRASNGGKLPYIIVIGLVTNYYPFGTDTLQAIIDTAGPGHQFVFITGYCGDYPRNAQNSTIKWMASSHGNVHAADWVPIVTANVNSYTYTDHTHLTPEGRSAYANLINGVVSSL